jgi:hypothetical protein
MDDFITATAVNNATSPTGRTLTVIHDRITSDQFGTLGSGDIGLDFKIKKGGTIVLDEEPHIYRSSYWSSSVTWAVNSGLTWSIPIPEDWTSGTYTIIWDWATPNFGSPVFDGFDSSTFTVPVLPASPPCTDLSDCITSPTVTASAYLNSTSSTGRTLMLSGNENWPESYGITCVSEWTSSGWVDLPPGTKCVHLQVSVYKDNVIVVPPPQNGKGYFTLYGEEPPRSGWKDWIMEIPEDLTGTYTIEWYLSGSNEGTPITANQMFPSSTTVTIPSLPGTAETEIVIPSWIKNNAGWWASNQIDDRAFVSGL